MKLRRRLILVFFLLIAAYVVYVYYMNRESVSDPSETGDAFRKPAAATQGQ